MSIKWILGVCASITAGLLLAVFSMYPTGENWQVSGFMWASFVACGVGWVFCCYVTTLSKQRKLNVFGVLARRTGVIVRWAPALLLGLTLPTAALLAAGIGVVFNHAFHADAAFPGVVVNTVFLLASFGVVVFLITAAWAIALTTQGTFLGFASVPSASANCLLVTPRRFGKSWELHVNETDGQLGRAIKAALEAALAYDKLPSTIVMHSHLFGGQPEEKIRRLVSRFMPSGLTPMAVEVSPVQNLGKWRARLVRYFYRRKFPMAKRDPARNIRKVIIHFDASEQHQLAVL